MSAFKFFYSLSLHTSLSRYRIFQISALNRFKRRENWNGFLREWFFVLRRTSVTLIDMEANSSHKHTHALNIQMKSRRKRERDDGESPMERFSIIIFAMLSKKCYRFFVGEKRDGKIFMSVLFVFPSSLGKSGEKMENHQQRRHER